MPSFPPPSFDSLTLAAVARDVRSLCLGARVIEVTQPSPEAVVIGLRRSAHTHHLLCGIRPRTARIHLVPDRGGRIPLPSFGQLLRSRLAEARLVEVSPSPFDRILRLRFDTLQGPVDLVAEIMGRHSNLILVDGDRVVGALKVVSERRSPRRPVLPGRPYEAPPADRPRPDTLDEESLRRLLVGETPVGSCLTRALRGFGPALAQEVALRAGVDPAAPASSAAPAAGLLHRALQLLCAAATEEAFAPTVYEQEGQAVAFAPVPLSVYGLLHAVPCRTMSEAVQRVYAAAERTAHLEERRRALEASVRAALRRREAALEEDRAALDRASEADRLRLVGELLLTYGHLAGPRASSLVVPDYTAGGAPLTIPLDPTATAAENASRFFRRYAKAKATARALPARITRLEEETRLLRDALVHVATASAVGDLEEVRADLVASGLLPGHHAPPRAPDAGGPRRFVAEDGTLILVGRSARENDRVTFHLAGPDDLWFHARGMAGAHVVLKSGGREPSEASLAAAASLAAYYSAGREAAVVAVDCVPRKRVRKPTGAPPGAVVYDGERTLRVAPSLPVTRRPQAPR